MGKPSSQRKSDSYPTLMMAGTSGTREVATIAGGCFWCLQPLYQDLRGVDKVEVGYTGGRLANPSYEAVCTDTTGHAEAVQITFDPQTIPFVDILRIFFSVHDPTTLNRQGADVGTQYRSAIFYHTPEQEKTAKQVIAEVNEAEIWRHPIVTEVAPLGTFYRAEEYHQDYFRKNPTAGYCRAVVAPKVVKFRKQFADRLRK
jgi:peptide-methionine (S)-S-oxide reductase